MLADEEYRKLQAALVNRLQPGGIIRGSGGLRKVHWVGSGRAPARVLLQVAAKHPRAVWNVARSTPRQIRRVAKAQRSVKPVTHVTAKGRRSPATPATRSTKENRYGPDKSHP